MTSQKSLPSHCYLTALSSSTSPSCSWSPFTGITSQIPRGITLDSHPSNDGVWFFNFFFYFCEDAKATGMERRRRENMRIWLKVLERNMVGKISLSNVWSKEEVDAFYTTGCFVFLPLPNMLQLFKWDILNRICGIHTYIRIEIYIYKWTLISRFGDNLGSAINIPRVEYRLSFLTQRSQ